VCWPPGPKPAFKIKAHPTIASRTQPHLCILPRPRVDEPRRHQQHLHPKRRQLNAQRVAQPRHRPLGRAVDAPQRHRLQPREGADVDDLAAALRHHLAVRGLAHLGGVEVGGGGLGAMGWRWDGVSRAVRPSPQGLRAGCCVEHSPTLTAERHDAPSPNPDNNQQVSGSHLQQSEDVGVERGVDDIHGHLTGRAERHYARIVDKNVQPARCRDHLLDRSAARLGINHVQLETGDPQLLERPRCFRPPRCGKHTAAAGVKVAGELVADAALCAARDQHHGACWWWWP